MKFKILLVLVTFLKVLYGQWTEQNSGITTDLYDVCFTDSLNGYAIGNSLVIHTSDGGDNWITQYYSFKNITRINAYDKNIAIITGDSEVVYITKNGGKNWIISNTGYPYHYYHSSFLNDSIIFITGTLQQEFYGGGLILRSTNSGLSWEKLYQTKYGVDPIPYWIDDLFFTSIDTGYAIFHISFDNFGPNYFMKTTNGGYSWVQISETPSMVLTMDHKERIIWAEWAGFNFSTNLGLSWQVATIAYWSILDMHIIRDNFGLFLIYEYYEDAMNYKPKLRFADITDSLFYDISLPDSFVAYSFSYVNEMNIWMAGKDGKIFKYNSKPTVMINPMPVYNFSLSQNYPNPFNPTTKIKFTIPALTSFLSPRERKSEGQVRVTLKVYSILGNEITTLVNEEKPAGSYEVEFSAGSCGDGSKLASGIYFYVLKIGENKLARKMCLIK
jgi:hypothetical protein